MWPPLGITCVGLDAAGGNHEVAAAVNLEDANALQRRRLPAENRLQHPVHEAGIRSRLNIVISRSRSAAGTRLRIRITGPESSLATLHACTGGISGSSRRPAR